MFVLTIDGVIRQESTGAPIPEGIELYEALSSTTQVAVLCPPERATAQHWLYSHNLTSHVQLVPEDHGKAPDVIGWRKDQITYLRAQGYVLRGVFDEDPRVVAAVHEMGIPAFLALHPKFTNPSFRPDWDSVARPWDELVSQVDYQIEQRVKANARVLESEIDT